MQIRKRVLYISYDCITEPLTSSQVLPYIKGLSEEYEIYLLTFNKKKVKKKVLNDIKENYGLRELFSLRYHKQPSPIATGFDILCGIIKTFFLVKKFDVSFIHARSYVAGIIAFVLKKITAVPYIFDIRGLLADERVDSGDWQKNSITYKIVKFCEKNMLKDSKKIVLLSHKGMKIIEDIAEGSKDKVTVIPTCCNIQLFSPKKASKLDNKNLRFVYFGSLGTWYMLSEMLDFFKIAKKMLKNVKFLILTQSDSSIVTKFIKDKHIDGDLIEVRNEAYNRVPQYLEISNISLFFIRPTFSKKVSCPTKFAESLSMGIPVITNSGIGDLDYFINKYSVGTIITNFQKENYEKALMEISEMLEKKDELQKRCRDLGEKEFSMSSGVNKYKELYRSII